MGSFLVSRSVLPELGEDGSISDLGTGGGPERIQLLARAAAAAAEEGRHVGGPTEPQQSGALAAVPST